MPVVFGDFVPLCGNTECRTKLKEMKRMFSEYLTLRFGYPFPIAEISVSGQLLQQHRWVVNYVQLDKKGNLGIASGAMPVSFLRPREIQPPPVGFWGACLGCAMNPRVEEERTRNMDLLSKLFVSSKSPVMFVVPNFEADVVFNYVSATHCSSPHCNKAAKDAMVSFLTVSMKKWKSEDDAWVNHKQCDYDLCKTLAPARFLKRCANCKVGFQAEWMLFGVDGALTLSSLPLCPNNRLDSTAVFIANDNTGERTRPNATCRKRVFFSFGKHEHFEQNSKFE